MGGLEAGRAGCSCVVSGDGGRGGPTGCPEPPTHAGTVFFPHVRQRWRASACEGHRDALADPRPPTDADRRELEDRRRNRDLAMEGKPWVPPGPLRAGGEGGSP